MKIAIIGCGQIGSRHLQAIVKLKTNLKIQVVEPNERAQRIGKDRLEDVSFAKNKKRIEWLRDISQIEKTADLTIVATTAKGRSEIIEKLLQTGHKRFLIEKMVCQSTREYKKLLESFDKNQAKGWVDCSRRYYPFYQKILDLLKGKTPIIFNVTAGNLGLGCNAIHFLDLFCAIIQEPQDIKLKGEYLFPELLPNQRGKDLIEFAGTITAKADNNFASITFHPESDAGIIVNILSKNTRVFIDEGDRKAFLTTKQNNWQWKKHQFKFKEIYTSTLTTEIAESIIKNDTCKLPTLQDSYYLHKELFQIFNQHIKLITGKNPVLCPIT